MAPVEEIVWFTDPAKDRTTEELQAQTISLLEKIARSQRVLEKRLDEIERLVAHHGMPSHFPQFRRLPPEIRHRVWSLAIPTRVLRPSIPNKEKLSMSPIRPPGVAGVCHEARAIATRNGGTISLTYNAGNPENPTRTVRHWFDSYYDVLELDRRIDIEGDEPRGIKSLVQRAKHILASRAEAEWFARLFQQTPSLERLSLKFDSVSVSSCTWEFGVMRRLFGSASTIVTMDLEDADDIARVKGILREYWRNPVFCAFDLESWARGRTTKIGTNVRDDEWMQRLPSTWMSEVARGWVIAKAAKEVKTKVGEKVEGETRGQAGTEGLEAGIRAAATALDVKHGFVRAALLVMPEVKFVRAFCRDEAHDVCRP